METETTECVQVPEPVQNTKAVKEEPTRLQPSSICFSDEDYKLALDLDEWYKSLTFTVNGESLHARNFRISNACLTWTALELVHRGLYSPLFTNTGEIASEMNRKVFLNFSLGHNSVNFMKLALNIASVGLDLSGSSSQNDRLVYETVFGSKMHTDMSAWIIYKKTDQLKNCSLHNLLYAFKQAVIVAASKLCNRVSEQVYLNQYTTRTVKGKQKVFVGQAFTSFDSNNKRYVEFLDAVEFNKKKHTLDTLKWFPKDLNGTRSSATTMYVFETLFDVAKTMAMFSDPMDEVGKALLEAQKLYVENRTTFEKLLQKKKKMLTQEEEEKYKKMSREELIAESIKKTNEQNEKRKLTREQHLKAEQEKTTQTSKNAWKKLDNKKSTESKVEAEPETKPENISDETEKKSEKKSEKSENKSEKSEKSEKKSEKSENKSENKSEKKSENKSEKKPKNESDDDVEMDSNPNHLPENKVESTRKFTAVDNNEPWEKVARHQREKKDNRDNKPRGIQSMRGGKVKY